ncbi:hypothetical protein BDW66DRAFT_125290 [Aspergillus desertorum]
MLKLMRNHPYLRGQKVKVGTVNSYQREGNDVVIIPLVRNGRQGIEFLSNAITKNPEPRIGDQLPLTCVKHMLKQLSKASLALTVIKTQHNPSRHTV